MPGWDLAISDDGGRTFRRSGSIEVHVDHHAIVIDPADPEPHLPGQRRRPVHLPRPAPRPGTSSTTWTSASSTTWTSTRPVPYRVGGGLQDNGSWIGPSATSFNSGSEDKPGHPERGLDRRLRRRRFPRGLRSGGSEHRLRHQPGRQPGPHPPGHAAASAPARGRRRGPGKAALQLGRAVPDLGPRPDGALPRRQQGLQADRTGATTGTPSATI